MNTAYRLYLGARNIGSCRFSREDLANVEAILNEYFHGWTSAKAVGRWQGKTEETLVITFTSQVLRSSSGRSDESTPQARTRPAEAALECCVRRLKEHLGQESVLLEQGGAVDLW